MIALGVVLLVMLGAMPNPSEKPLMTVDELLAAVPGWPGGRSATYEAVRRGELPSVRIGRRLFIVTSALCRLLGLDDARVGPIARNGAPDPTKAPFALSPLPTAQSGDADAW